ncbi:MAG: alpha/beta hydrolase [Bacteroidota bacterium]
MRPILLLFINLLWLGCTQPASQTKADTGLSFLSFDQTRIAYTDEGKGDAVILIHGFISNGSSWNKTVLKQSLLDAGYRVIVPDLRGNGRSDRPQTPEAYQNDAEIKDLMALADHLSLSAYTATGYSRGSIVLAKLLTLDTRIQQAVIGGMGSDFTNPGWDRRIAFADAFSGRAELSDLTRGAVEYAQSIDADIKALGLLQDYQPVTTPAELQAVQIPVLIICGDQDRDNGDPAELQKYLPGSQLTIVAGDHNNTYKQANFAEAVLDFLTK